jgi:hypothetical protein
MKTTRPRMSYIAALLLIPGAFAMKEADRPDAQVQQGHSSGLTARITLPDGTIQMAKLEGLGCSASVCSRVAIKGKTDGGSVSFWLDTIAAIKDTTQNDALLVLKNGTEQRMSLLTDFRVLYLANRSQRSEKLDLAKIKSLELLPVTPH